MGLVRTGLTPGEWFEGVGQTEPGEWEGDGCVYAPPSKEDEDAAYAGGYDCEPVLVASGIDNRADLALILVAKGLLEAAESVLAAGGGTARQKTDAILALAQAVAGCRKVADRYR